MIAGIPVCLSNLYFDYPLKQGLRQTSLRCQRWNICKYFDYPLKQGLRPISFHLTNSFEMYFDYPLKQGLRQGIWLQEQRIFRVFWLSIKTRIKTRFRPKVSRPLPGYFDYPLKQGLRRNDSCISMFLLMYFDYPLKQGLRQKFLLS